MGDVSDTRKQILQNTLTDELKKYFRIVPQEKYEQVLEQVFEELEYEECSEDTCIMRVQEMLQVENVFHLQVIGEGKDSQLNLKWITLDEKKNEEDYCKGCGTFELREMIGGLVEKLVGVKEVDVVVQKKPVVVVEKKEKGVLYSRYENGNLKWYKSGDEKPDEEWEGQFEKYEGEIENGVPNGQGTLIDYWAGKYVGEFKDGTSHGHGTFTWTDRNHTYYSNKYVGEFKDGRQNGQGTLTWGKDYIEKLSSSTGPSLEHKYFVGEFLDGEVWNVTVFDKNMNSIGVKYVNGKFKDEKKGKGILYWGKRNGNFDYYTKKWEGVESEYNKDHGKYEGEIVNGVPNGQGTVNYSDLNKYTGEWKDGLPSGQGTFTWSGGMKYVGEMKEGLPNGQGTQTYSDGRKYVGELREGKYNGQGTLTWSDGGKYVGEFMHGKEHGQGTKTQSNGIKYVGRWKNGLPNGQGTMTTPDGGKYVGEFKNLKKYGQGTKTFPDGREYVGEYKDDYYHGQGTFTFPDGRKFVGEFKEGKPWNSILSKYGRIIGTWVNGVLQK